MKNLEAPLLRGTVAYLRELTLDDAPELHRVRTANRDFVRPYEPVRPDADFTVEGHRRDLARRLVQRREDLAYSFGIFDAATDDLVGMITLSNVVRAALQSATVGYWVDQASNGRGIASDAVRLVVRFAFERAGLHRVSAGVMPHNLASRRVLEKVGFRHEGRALRYLYINGVWEDHEMFAITVEEWSQHG